VAGFSLFFFFCIVSTLKKSVWFKTIKKIKVKKGIKKERKRESGYGIDKHPTTVSPGLSAGQKKKRKKKKKVMLLSDLGFSSFLLCQ
jgi:hypothetical protein